VEMRRAWHREPQWLRTHHIFVTALELHPEQSEAMTLRALESDLLTFWALDPCFASNNWKAGGWRSIKVAAVHEAVSVLVIVCRSWYAP